MDTVKRYMSQAGMFLATIGIFSIVLAIIYHLGIASFEVRVLLWIDSWGIAVGWAIRIGITIAGAALYFLGRSESASEED